MRARASENPPGGREVGATHTKDLILLYKTCPNLGVLGWDRSGQVGAPHVKLLILLYKTCPNLGEHGGYRGFEQRKFTGKPMTRRSI
jgi:hypothetical protein